MKYIVYLCLLLLAGSLRAEITLGTLQPAVENAARAKAAGLELVVLELSWDHFEPEQGQFSEQYLEARLGEAELYRQAGLRIILDLGVQYPPGWVLKLPNALYRNQYGDVYQGRGPGKNVANSVFSGSVRAAQAAYVQRVCREMDREFFAVRIGGGWFGELTYPEDKFAGQVNCYWAFDDAAQGRDAGLPTSVGVCPVPRWRPGEASRDHQSAQLFLGWYLDALANYLQFQVELVETTFKLRPMVLFPSWGIRPGQAEAAIAGDLSGKTPPEMNGEIARGVDFARQIRVLRGPAAVIHCTWLDADPSFGPEPPIHYLAALARAHDPPLKLSAENTGGGGRKALDLCARRAKEFQLSAFLWAFEPDLVDGQPPDLEDFTKAFNTGGP